MFNLSLLIASTLTIHFRWLVSSGGPGRLLCVVLGVQLNPWHPVPAPARTIGIENCLPTLTLRFGNCPRVGWRIVKICHQKKTELGDS